ncbi:MAG: type II CRISPR RNA-guided endonuclease Cas9 [Thermomonas sp.]
MKFKQRYRLGLDIGTNSIGWCVLRLNEQDEPIGIIRAGSRIFSDGRSPKTLASLAADRRAARQMRRRHDRVLKRQARFMDGLIRFGLMPIDDEERMKLSTLDPYQLRRKGLDQPLTAFELGRALYHLAKRRGFKSSRKSKGENENEAGKIASAIQRTSEAIQATGCRTMGEFLAKRHDQRETVRARTTADGKEYLLYTQRVMVAAEFDALWAAQTPHHPDVCTEEAREYLRDTLLFQRPLLPVQPGRCIFETEEFREPLWSPLQQQFRVLQELNNLRIVEGLEERPLTLDQRNLLRDALYRSRECSFAKIKKLLELPRTARFNLESEKRKGLKGDIVASQLGAENALGEAWFDIPFQNQRDLAELVDRIDDSEELKTRLMDSPWKFDESVAVQLTKVRLPEDYGSLSRKALEKIVPILDAEVITYDKAALKAGYNHSDFYTGEILPHLPYYGELLRSYTSPTPKAKDPDERKFGKLANPTVHIGLNQLRKLVNEVIRRWGQPTEIIVELARDFGLSGQKRRDLESQQAENQKRNENLDERLRSLNQRINRENRQRLMLWDELGKEDANDRYCAYSGQHLSITQLFDGSVEVDHILPFSRSLDDGLANKVLCITRANRDKKNSTPFEAFGHSPSGYNWTEIEERASRLPKNKAKRFKENALQDFLGEKDFLDRHLTDTAYLSRVARQYLTAVCPPNKVWVATGRLTAMLRQKYGLNEILDPERLGKNRNDHRHHAVDAAVIAICNRSLIQKISTAAGRAEDMGEHRLLKSLDPPWVGFRDELEAVIRKIVVSHKPDHGREAGLHNDTNYGKRGEPDKKGAMLVSVRKPLTSLTSGNAGSVADPVLRDELTKLIDGLSGKELKAVLDAYSLRTGVRSVRMEERLSVIPIDDRMTKQPYRYVKGDGNYCYDIYREENGRWGGDVVSSYDANRPDFNLDAKKARNGKPLVMRLRKGDIIKVEHEGKFKFMRIAKFTDGQISMAEHHEANVDARERSREDSFSYMRKGVEPLRKVAARVVGVDMLGYVNDPGFKE